MNRNSIQLSSLPSQTHAVLIGESITLGVHIIAGGIALLAGVCALVTIKGGHRHRIAGRVYVGSMGVVVGTVFPLLVFDPTPNRIFLTLIAIFSGYFAFSGYRVLSQKRTSDTVGRIDWIGALLVIGACLSLGGWGVGILLAGDSFGTVMTVFGAIGLFVGFSDLREFRSSEQRGPWMIDHLWRMTAAYMATVTAVSAVNFSDIFPIGSWLWPTVVGFPLVWYWLRKYGNVGPFARLYPVK